MDKYPTRLTIPYLTDEQGDYLRGRMSQGRQTLLVTVDKRTVMIDLDAEEVVSIADSNREHFSAGGEEVDWALAMCRFAESRMEDGLLSGAAMLLCNIDRWCQMDRAWTIFHVTKVSELEAQIAVTNVPPDRLTDHDVHKAPKSIN